MLRDAKIGDRVKSYLDGWGTIIDISTAIAHSQCIIKSDSGYTFCVFSDGKREPQNVNPDIIEYHSAKWEPKFDRVFLRLDGGPHYTVNYMFLGELDSIKKEGRTFESREQARKASKLIRPFQRQLNWLLEHHPDEDGQWSKETCYMVYKKGNVYDTYNEYYDQITLNAIHMSESAAKHLANELNAGRVEL